MTENKTTDVSHLTTVQNDTDLSRLQKTILDNNESVGIAYIGYVGYEANEQEVYSFLDNSQYADKYDFLCGSPLVNVGGAELYAVVIADTEYIASVYRAEITDNGEYSVKTDDAIYKYSGYGIDYFLLRCNESEIHSNVSLLFEKGNSSFSVFPMLSGMDGHLVAENFYDFSIYSDYGDDSEAEDKKCCNSQRNSFGVSRGAVLHKYRYECAIYRANPGNLRSPVLDFCAWHKQRRPIRQRALLRSV